MALSAAVTFGCGSDAKHVGSDAGAASADSGAADYSGCPDTIPPFVPGMVVVGDTGVLQLSIVESSPRLASTFRNEWTLEARDADGTPLEDAEVTKLQTYMPVHGHDGLPAPAVETSADPSRLDVELYFQMRGPWEVRFDVTSKSAGSDHVVFDVCVPE